MTDDREFFRRSVDREVDDELAFHLAMRARELADAGGDATYAAEKAADEFGDVRRVKDECRRIAKRRDRQLHRARFVHELRQDVRFAFRLLRRRTTYAALAIATIALGIGAATSIFSVVDGVLLRALPFVDPGRLAAVWITQPKLRTDPVLARYATSTVFGSGEFYGLRDGNTSFQSLALWAESPAMLVGPSANEQVMAVRTTAEMLPVLGEHVVLGRDFLPSENVLHGARVALISWESWQSRFGGDSSILGRRVVLDDSSYTIVGVLPSGLRLNRSAEPSAFWIPALQEEYDQPSHRNRGFRVVGRLKPGVSARTAQLEAQRRVRAAAADTTLGARVDDWQYDQTKDARGPLYIILAASGLLLLIGCVNVAMLTLGEAASRDREFATRISLGASAGRVVRQLLAESMTIAAAGAAVGAALAWGLTHALVSLAPTRLPGIDGVRVDLRVLSFTIACAAGAGIFFGLAPALSLVRAGENSLTRVGAGQSPHNARRTQRTLVATEIALSLMLLVGAGLLARSLDKLSAVDPGFRAAGLGVVRLTAPSSFYADDARRTAYYREAVSRLSALPGVEGVTAGANVPYTGGSSSSPLAVQGRTYDADHPAPHTEQRSVMPGYFEMLNIPVRAGRSLLSTDREGSEPVAVISEAAARRDFPGESPIDRIVLFQGKPRRIVGVVGDVRAAKLTSDGGPAIYVPMAQHMTGNVSFVIRGPIELPSLSNSVRETLRGVDPTVVPAAIDRLPALVSRSFGEERYRTVIVAVFALLAAVLASVGLYGVTLRTVTRRTREVGIRVALGATATNVTGLLMRDTIIGVGIGIAVGVPLSLAAARQLAPFLFRVTPSDPAVFGAVLVMLAFVAGVASVVPASRASRADPRIVLAGD